MRTCFALLILVLTLSGCAAPASPSPTPHSIPTVAPKPIPTETAIPAPALSAIEGPTATATPSPRGTAKAAMVCPTAETVCIVAGHFFFQRPLAPPANIFIDQTYRYGTTEQGTREPHHGIDFPNKQGTPVLAAGDGQVVAAGNDKQTLYGWVTSFYGNLVVIEHSLPGFTQPVYTLYGHLYRVDVTVGQQVKAGEQIGAVGSTGIAIGSHLHLETRLGADTYKATRNPELWVQPPPGMGVLAGSVQDAQGNPVKSTINIQRMQDGVILTDPIYQIESYARESLNADDVLRENFAIGELTAGEYRLTMIYYGKVYEQLVQIEPGKLTIVEFRP